MLRKTLMLAALTGFVGGAALNPAFSQGLPPDDFGFEIETAEEPKQESFLANLSQYFGATAGSNSGTSAAVDRSISAIAVEIDLPEIAGLKSAFNFDIGNYNNTYKLELSGDNRNRLPGCQQNAANPELDASDYNALTQAQRNQIEYFYENECYNIFDEDTGQYLQPEVQRVVQDSFTEMTEAYIQWEPTSFATIRLGRQPIVLGQFEVFSPLMFTTPMKARGTKTKTTKADLSYAQDGLQISLFPTSQIELSFTSIPNMRLDPVNEKRFQEFALLKGDFVNFVGDEQSETLQDIGDNDMSVARLMYYGNRLTFGLTAIQGVETNEDPIREARLVSVGCETFFSNNRPPDGSECAGGWNTVTDGFGNTYQQPAFGVPGQGDFDTYSLGQDEGLRYAEMEAIALEARLNLTDKLSFIYEVTIVEGEKELGILPFGGESGEEPRIWNPSAFLTSDPSDDRYAGSTRLLPFFDQVFNDNDAKPYINVETTMHSGGFIYQGDRLLINAQLAQRVQKGASELEEQLRKNLDWDTYQGEDTEENGSGASDILPIVNAVLLLGGEKQGFIGAGFGTFGQNFGFGLSGGWRFFEKLEIGAFGGMALDVTGADEIEAEGYDTPEDEGYVSFGVNYLF